MLTRRAVLAFSALSSLSLMAGVRAETLPSIAVYKDPNCGCCGLWVKHLREGGFTVTVSDTPAMRSVKKRLGVPDQLASCHTAEVAGYVVEGHVPVEAIKRLLAEKPFGKGIAVAGMPIGSPGMEAPGVEEEIYEVRLFGAGDDRLFARYKGLIALNG